MHLHACMQKSLLLIIPLHLTTSLCPFLPALIFFVSFHVWRSTLLFRRSQLCQNVSYWIHLESRCIRPIFSIRSILYVFSVVMLETIERLPSTKDILMNIALIIVQLWMRVGKIHLSSLVGLMQYEKFHFGFFNSSEKLFFLSSSLWKALRTIKSIFFLDCVQYRVAIVIAMHHITKSLGCENCGE